LGSEVQIKKNSYVSCIIFFISLVIVTLHIIPVIFPAFYTVIMSEIPSSISIYEPGELTFPLVVTNLFLLAFGMAYYKNRIPSIFKKFISFVQNFEVSKKVVIIFFIVSISIYTVVNLEEIERNEIEDFADFKNIQRWLTAIPTLEGEGKFRYVHIYLDYWSQEYFGNIRIIPFISSVALLVVTYLFTFELTKKRFSGLIAMTILFQSFIFYRFDASATYPTYWILFYLLSLYLIHKKWHLSALTFLISISGKALTVAYIPLTLFFIFRSNLSNRRKIYVTLSYVVLIILMASILFSDRPIVGQLLDFQNADFWNAFTAFAFEMRFDGLVVIFLLPLTVLLFLLSRKGVKNADSVLILMVGTLFFSAPLLQAFTEYTVQPYRFLPTVVFFAVGIGVLFAKRINQD